MTPGYDRESNFKGRVGRGAKGGKRHWSFNTLLNNLSLGKPL